MKLALASTLVLVSVTHARADDTGMKVVQMMMRCPAISSTGSEKDTVCFSHEFVVVK